MKKLYKSIAATSLAMLTIAFSSCLKDSRLVSFTNVGTLVELPLAAYVGTSFSVQALPIQTTPQNIPVVINVASPKPLTTALNVTLKLNTDTIAALNNQYIADSTAYQNDTTGTVAPPTAPGRYSLPPAAAYSISSLTATIPANQRTASITISVTTSLFNPLAYYLIPITLVNASGQKISNYNTVLFNVQAKNKYDGQYTVTGTMVDNANANLTGKYPLDYYLKTQGASSVGLFDYQYAGGYGHEILSSGATSYYGFFAPVFTFDANNNVVSVVNYYGQPASNGRSAALDPTGQNKFISGTPGVAGATFQVSYYLVQPTGTNRTHFVETYKYDGPRP